ncbi:MAG: hypothetical protein M3Q56_08500 [Bacteroidota bacterium]|nr:hypothetical protein [Bacteroidota bacterium]
MNEKSKIILGGALLIILISLTIYFTNKEKRELKESGITTICITYDTYLLGRGGTLRYFFKAPNGIYTGATNTFKLKAPGYYYKLRYSLNDPSISELYRDSLVPDSVGVKFIKLEDIERSRIINGDNIPDWQWK